MSHNYDRPLSHTQEQTVLLTEILSDAMTSTKFLIKRLRGLTERLARVRKLVPGRQRIYKLNELSAMLYYDAGEESDEQYAKKLNDYALYVERLQWDLMKLRDVVRGDERMKGNKYDPANWIGERP